MNAGGRSLWRRRLFVHVLLWRRVYANDCAVMSSCTSDSKRAVFGAWLNKCFVYNEEDVLSYKTWRMFYRDNRADPRLLGALCKTVSAWGWGGVWGVRVMNYETPLSVFTPSRIALFRGSVRFFFFFCLEQETMTFTLHDLPDFYVERATAHRIKRNEHSCFLSRWPNSKTKLKLHHLWEQEGPLRSLRLHIGRIGSG